MSSIAAIVLGIAVLGGGTIGLAPDDAPVAPITMEPDRPAPPPDDDGGGPPVPGALGLGVVAAALALLQRRSGGLSPAAGLGLDTADPLFVFVPGHGQPHGSRAFAELIDLMGLDDESVRFFDYRWAGGGSDHALVSRGLPIDDAASSLNAYLAGVAAEGREVYVIGFSKGGATIAEMVADWDDGLWGPSESIRGVALLDPPIAAGAHGWLQSLGSSVGPIPDDGGFDPVQCSFVVFGCDDRRSGLGEASGVDVIVVRNPRAAITSFSDLPDGLRVYDAPDDGPGPWRQLLSNPFDFPGRIAKAHESVLHDPRVAACLVAEAGRAGTCRLDRRRPTPPLSGLGGSATRPPSGQKVL